ncbi:MAG: hypothetical protein ACRCYT_05190 [Cetobacterium sp.]
MTLKEYLEQEIKKHELEIEKIEKSIFAIRNGLDLEAGEERDLDTINILVGTKQTSIVFKTGAIRALNDILSKIKNMR